MKNVSESGGVSPSPGRLPCPPQPASSLCLCRETPDQLLLKSVLPAEFCPRWYGKVFLWLSLEATSFTSPLSLNISCKWRRWFAFSLFLYMSFNKRLLQFLIKWRWEQRPVEIVFIKIIIRNSFVSAKARKSQTVSTFLEAFLFLIKTRKWDILICKFDLELKNIHSSFLRFLLNICLVVSGGFFPLIFLAEEKIFLSQVILSLPSFSLRGERHCWAAIPL